MKKKLLLSMILLALCLIQASADTYYFKIQLSNADGTPGAWSNYIPVDAVPDGVDANGKTKYKYPNGLRTLLNGGIVTDKKNPENTYTLPKNDKNEVVLDRIYGIAFANGKGKDNNSAQQNIMEGDEFAAWKKIREHIKYLDLHYYQRDKYTDKSYCMDMHKVEELELPKDGMKVGNGDLDCNMYFANADNLKKITIDYVDITDDVVKDKFLLDRVGKYMFSNCYSLSTKYINRLIKNVTAEIKDNAFSVDKGNRDKFSDEADNKMAIEIPSSVTTIGSQAFYNRVKVTGLKIQGNDGLEIGSEAFRGCEQLNALNLDNAKITYLGTGVFGDCRSMTNEFVNGVLNNYAAYGGNYAANGKGKKIPAYLFFGCNGQDGYENKCSFTDLDIPAEFTEIGDGAFASTGDAVIKLKTITVNSKTAPTCLCEGTDEYAKIKNKSVFAGLEANMTTVIFANAAQNWEETETTGFLTYMNDGSEFERLLTKDLYSDHTEYINVPQQHAIVRLHRTLKEGWNTICLPFGVNYRYCSSWGEDYKAKQAYNTRIIVNGLTNNSYNFTMGVYRGYWPEGKTFMFLHYTGFDEYPLDLGETFLVKMRKDDIAENGIYTFRNVDLNYRWSADGKDGNDGNWTSEIYSADKMSAKEFDGSVNIEDIPFKGKASYDDYVLKGSLVQRTGTVGDSQGIITTDDYFFQQSKKNGTMKLYPYTAGQKYGIRGFSGWFHHKTNNSSSKASELSLSLFDDGSTTPIETVKVDDLNRDTSGKVYSISGVLMKNNAADLNNLPKGIYVVNGKKYVVK
nr:leucine-rich repeat domain-containing protein [Prevotella sp.]